MTVNIDEGIELFITAAEEHGKNSGEPEHQVGDLENIVRRAWALMSNDQRLALASDPEVLEQFELDGDTDALGDLIEALS